MSPEAILAQARAAAKEAADALTLRKPATEVCPNTMVLLKQCLYCRGKTRVQLQILYITMHLLMGDVVEDLTA